MTYRQILAYRQPCARGPETLNGEFRQFLRRGTLKLSAILTVNK